MRILGLDLGSRIGWSIIECGESYRETEHGFLDLVDGDTSSKRSQSVKKIAACYGTDARGYDPRPVKLFRVVQELIEKYQITDIAFEDVQFHNSTAQSHLWASLRGVMWAAAGDRPIGWHAIPVGTIKKFATGRGDASKTMMMNALLGLGLCITDDNEADAIWVGLCAAEGIITGSHEKISGYRKI